MRHALIALLAAAAIAATGGCGTEDVSPEAVAEAARATAGAGGMRMHMEMTMPGPAGEPIEVAGDGSMDPKGQRGEMTMDLGQIPGGEGEMEMIFERFVMWWRMPLFEGRLPRGAEWVRIDLQKAGEELGFDLDVFTQFGNDPTRQLDVLRATGDVEKEGEEEVRGVPTTH